MASAHLDNLQASMNVDYYFVVKTGNDIILSNKKFVITQRANPCVGQFLTSMWFNPQIKSNNYKENIWLGIVKVPKNASIEEKRAIKQQIHATQVEYWANLTCFAYVGLYRWELFFSDITDGSKDLVNKENGQAKIMEISLPCQMKGDDNRLGFSLTMTYQKRMESEQYTENDLFRNNEQKDSDVLTVCINCPSFTLQNQ